MKETTRILIPEDKVDERIAQLGEQISKDYEGKQVHLIGILKGSIFFICATISLTSASVFLKRTTFSFGMIIISK